MCNCQYDDNIILAVRDSAEKLEQLLNRRNVGYGLQALTVVVQNQTLDLLRLTERVVKSEKQVKRLLDERDNRDIPGPFNARESWG